MYKNAILLAALGFLPLLLKAQPGLSGKVMDNLTMQSHILGGERRFAV